MMKRMLPLVLAFLLLLSGCCGGEAAETSAPTETTQPVTTEATQPETEPTEVTEPELLPSVLWNENLLRWDFLEVLGVSRSSVKSVTFLANRKEAPADAVELTAGTGSVLGWVRDGVHVFVAADRGINGAEAAPGLFEDCVSLESVTFGDAFRVDLAQSLTGMFRGCVSLRSVDTRRLVTSGVTDMSSLFEGCMSLTSVDVAQWDTSAVMDMTWMFRGCMSLEDLAVDGWNVEKVQFLDSLFEGCTSLRQLDLSGWKADAAQSMSGMFMDCVSLRTIGSFPKDHDAMDDTTFSGCGVLNP